MPTDIFRGNVCHAVGGWLGALLVSGREDCGHGSTSEVRVANSKGPEATQDGATSFPCADGSLKQFNLPRPVPMKPAQGDSVADEEETCEETESEEENKKTLEHQW